MRCSRSDRRTPFPGAVSFKLYDTYGLALDEQEDMARERGFAIDREGFEREMETQRERARASWKGAEKGAVAPAYQKLLEQGRTRFLGYERSRSAPRASSACWSISSRSTASPPARTPNWYSTRRRSTPKPAARWAIAARSIPTTGEKVADVETAFPAVPGLTVHRIAAHGADSHGR